MKKTLLSLVAVYVIWSALDVVLHVGILSSAYAATPQLWRPMPEMKMWLMHGTVLVYAASFVLIYAWLVTDKNMKSAMLYGVLFGVGSGITMGYGSYSVMPLPYAVAFWWFFGRLIEAVIGGWILGVMMKKRV